MYTEEEICRQLSLNADEIVNIYPYGFRIYGNHVEDADYDYVRSMYKTIGVDTFTAFVGG